MANDAPLDLAHDGGVEHHRLRPPPARRRAEVGVLAGGQGRRAAPRGWADGLLLEEVQARRPRHPPKALLLPSYFVLAMILRS